MTSPSTRAQGRARSGQTVTPLAPSLVFTAIDPAYAKVLRLSCLCYGLSFAALCAGLGFWFEQVWLWAMVAVVLLDVFVVLCLATRNSRAYGYFEGEDELFVCRGLMWRTLSAVPYGRMQQVVVRDGPFLRRYRLATVSLETASVAANVSIPGLAVEEAERLRVRLTELGQAKMEGL